MSFIASLFRPIATGSSAIASSSKSMLVQRTFTSTPVSLNKLKSHSGTKKRFFKTGSGLYKRGQAGKRHLNTLFSATRINRLGRTAYASLSQAKKIRKLIPHA